MGTDHTPFVFQDPLQNTENTVYWERAQERVLLLRHCQDCNTPHHYPRPYCPHCGSDRTQWRAASGAGEIYAFTRMVRGVDVPYMLAYVTLDEGVTLLTHLRAGDWDAVHIGMRVQVDFAPSVSGQNVPVFVPV